MSRKQRLLTLLGNPIMSKLRCTLPLVGVFFLFANQVMGDGFEWKSAVDGDFLDPAKWDLLYGSTAPPPRDGDSAVFNEAGSYTVTFASGGTLRNHFMDVLVSDVTFRRSSPTIGAAYLLERPGGVLRLDDGATLQIGVPNYPLDFTAEDYVSILDESQLVVTDGSRLVADRILLYSGADLSVESGATVTATSDLVVGSSGTNSDPSAVVEVAGPGSSLEAAYLRVGQQDGQSGSVSIYQSAAVSVETLDLTLGGRIDISAGTLSIGKLGNSQGPIYYGSEGSLSIASNALIGPNGLHGDVNFLSPANTLQISGVGTLEINQELVMKGGKYEGGTLVVSSGASIISNEAEVSTIAAAVQGGAGSAIALTAGELRIGDAGHVKGFYSNGTTSVSNGMLRILDANDAVFDSGALVQLGSGNSSGTVVAQNGIALDLGADLVGYGTVDTPDDPLVPLINNGHITGNSNTQKITLSGYIQGFGTCDYCKITGTDAPGMSTASVNRGTVEYDGTLEIEIGGTIPGSGHDQLNHVLGVGLADLGGTLEVKLFGGFQPAAGDAYEILAAQSITGQFDTEALPSIPGKPGLQFAVDYDYSLDRVLLSVAPVFEADFDEDLDVDTNDLAIWQAGYGIGALHTQGDADADGEVVGQDFLIWQNQLGSGVSSVAVPEPTTTLSLFMGIAITVWMYLAGRRRFNFFADTVHLCSPIHIT